MTPFEQNARCVLDAKSGHLTVVDPGGDIPSMISVIDELGFQHAQVVITHAHIDHVGGCEDILKYLSQRVNESVPLFGHKIESQMRQSIQTQAMMYGLSPAEFKNVREPDTYVEDGDIVHFGTFKAKALFTPGHAPGHLSFYFEKNHFELRQVVRGILKGTPRTVDAPIVIAGDALFSGSIGRTDLPGGSHEVLIRSIKEKLLTLPNDTIVLSGHGPDTTIGVERKNNPFLR